jgi:hypothetical protein
MSTDVVDISALIKAKVAGIAGIHQAYEYEPDKSDDGKYPYATVHIERGEAEFGDTIRNIRRHTFQIILYQERTAASFGNEKAERITRELIDAILTAFDNDTQLGGQVQMVRPLSYDATYESTEVGDTRVVRFEGECMTVVNSA